MTTIKRPPFWIVKWSPLGQIKKNNQTFK